MINMLDDFVEVTIDSPDKFLLVKETLTRIGIASKKDKILYQSCHILHKQGKLYIVSFKEMFMLDGKQTDFTDDDKSRRNTIANLLAEWNLVTLVNPDKTKSPVCLLSQIKILSFKDKVLWKLESKYTIGKKKKEVDGNK